MFNKQLRANIKELDLQISKLTIELDTIVKRDEYELQVQKIEDLTEIRCKLAESKVEESHAPVLISGALGIASILIVLNFEKTDIVTSKAFGIATKMFRGV